MLPELASVNIYVADVSSVGKQSCVRTVTYCLCAVLNLWHCFAGTSLLLTTGRGCVSGSQKSVALTLQRLGSLCKPDGCGVGRPGCNFTFYCGAAKLL